MFLRALLFAIVLSQAQAQNLLFDVWELDGNQVATPPANVQPEDWSDIFTCCPVTKRAGAFYINDGTTSTIFSSGATKDDGAISTWTWSSGSVPSKNDIVNVYAYVEIHPVTGDVILVFGGDLLTNDGSANLGLWLLQDPTVAPVSGGVFSGAHRNGDLFLALSYTNGGSTTTAYAYQWPPITGSAYSGLSIGNNLILGNDAARCTSTVNQVMCLTVNSAQIQTGIFDRYGSSKPPNGFNSKTIPANAFFEGAINLNELYSGADFPCFSTFLLETRSSPSITAELKDFATGGFLLCGGAATNTCPRIGYSGGAYRVTTAVVVSNTGAIAFTAHVAATLSDYTTLDPKATQQADVTVPAGQSVTVNIPYNLGASYPSAFTSYVKVTFPGTVIAAKTLSDLCEPAPDFTVSSACTAPSAIAFRPSGALGFGYRVAVTVTNTVGTAKSCSLTLNSAPGVTIISAPSPVTLSVAAPVSTGTISYDMLTSSSAPAIVGGTVTCTDGATFTLGKSVPTASPTCPGYTHDYTATKSCTAAPIADPAAAPDGWLYSLRIAVTSTGTGELWCTLSQPTTTYTVVSSTPTLPITSPGLTFGPSGSTIPPASRTFDLTAKQRPSQQTTIGALADTAAVLACVDAAGNAVTPSTSPSLLISSPSGFCVAPFSPGIDVNKLCSAGVGLDGTVQITALGSVLNLGNVNLKITGSPTFSVFNDRDGSGRGSSTTNGVNLYSNSARTTAITTFPYELTPGATIYYRDVYTPINPIINTGDATCTGPPYPARCLSYTDTVTATAVPSIVANDAGASAALLASTRQTDTATCTAPLCP